MTTTTIQEAKVKVGDVFYRSWGYDQTNINFYEIVSVSKTGKTAKARELRTVAVKDDGGPTTYVTAATDPDRFVTDTRCARCSNYHWDGISNDRRVGRGPGWDGHAFTDQYTYQTKHDRVTVDSSSGDHAYRWDGTPKYQTGFGWGH